MAQSPKKKKSKQRNCDTCKTNKDFELQKALLKTKNYEIIFKFLTVLLKLGCIIWAIICIMDGLKPLFLNHEASALEAVAKIIEAIGLPYIIGAIAAIIFGGGWYLERKGKKRAIKEKGKYQKELEKNDSYRSSSGLTAAGDTPTEGENND